MSRIKLLLQVTEDVQALADSLRELVNGMKSGEPEQSAKKEESIPEKPIEQPKLKVTLEEVRAVLARKSQAGFTAQVQSIIQQFDAKKLSEVKPEYYEEIVLLAEELSND